MPLICNTKEAYKNGRPLDAIIAAAECKLDCSGLVILASHVHLGSKPLNVDIGMSRRVGFKEASPSSPIIVQNNEDGLTKQKQHMLLF